MTTRSWGRASRRRRATALRRCASARRRRPRARRGARPSPWPRCSSPSSARRCEGRVTGDTTAHLRWPRETCRDVGGQWAAKLAPVRLATLGGWTIAPSAGPESGSPTVPRRHDVRAWGNPDHEDSTRIIHRGTRRRHQLRRHADVYSSGESEEIVGKASRSAEATCAGDQGPRDDGPRPEPTGQFEAVDQSRSARRASAPRHRLDRPLPDPPPGPGLWTSTDTRGAEAT